MIGRRTLRPGQLTYLLRNEPNTFDPAKSPGSGEAWIFAAFFEPLLQAHPQTLEPMAGLATHYKVERGGTQYTFYLRGLPAPQGKRLPGRESLEPEFSRGTAATLNGLPARWSDRVPITAQDLVYSWRRYLAPETGFSSAYYLYYVCGAEEVNSGKRSPKDLAVVALGDFAFQVDLRAPAPDFVTLCCTAMTLPMPSHAIEKARKAGHEASWTEPVPGERIPVQFASLLEGRRDFHIAPAAFGVWALMNTRRPPCDDPLVRFAINMSVDKARIANVLGTGRAPAKGFVPPMPGYLKPESVPVEVGGRVYNVLEHNPEAAGALLGASRYGSGRALKVERPKVRGLGLDPLGIPSFKYAWIDPKDKNWRPSMIRNWRPQP